jgi:hypothetical protein
VGQVAASTAWQDFETQAGVRVAPDVVVEVGALRAHRGDTGAAMHAWWVTTAKPVMAGLSEMERAASPTLRVAASPGCSVLRADCQARLSTSTPHPA